MKRYLRELKPDQFEDIVAMGALYRPGPMAEIPRYIEGKHNPTHVQYLHASLEPILKNTYGVMVYQEQIIVLLQLIAGYTPGQADLVRKAIGKKKRDIMAAEEPKFIAGCLAKGLNEQQANSLWALIQPFADYSFNKAHASCYGLIAYQTAYLKAHYPAAYMAALMTSDHDNIERIAIEVSECKRMGVQVLPPDVNESFREFGVNKESNTIRFGMCAIKNVGDGAIEAILAAREADGPFASAEDFAKRVSASEVNKKVWESLIKCGAMDSFGDRNTLLANLDTIVGYASKAQKNALSGQIDIFGSLGTEDNMPGLRLDEPTEQSSTQERLGWEKELLGLYISKHPLDEYEAYMADKLTPIGHINPEKEGQTVKIGGITTTVRKIVTKNNATMAFVGLEDKTGSLELVVFPRAYEIMPEIWQPDQVIQVAGKVSYKDRDGRMGTELKIMVDKAVRIGYESAKAYAEKHPESKLEVVEVAGVPQFSDITIRVHSASDQVLLMRIKALLTRHEGDAEVFLLLEGESPKKIRLPLRVNPTPKLLEALKGVVGEDFVEAAPIS
jgi:DNA polymerase-3 subunit alpha